MNWNKVDGQKTRDLPMVDYLEILQKEYVVMEIRAKIYPTSKDKTYYKGIMSHKRAKIEDISKRNSIPSIFNDTGMKNYIDEKIINVRGIPNFIYRDKMAKDKYEQRDVAAYFHPGADVKVYTSDKDSDFKFGKIESYEPGSNHVLVVLRGESTSNMKHVDQVTRIL